MHTRWGLPQGETFALDRSHFVMQSEPSSFMTLMKILARIGAILSFTFFFFPAVLLFRVPDGYRDSTLATVMGLCLLGLAVFLGTILWVVGEKCCSEQDNK